MAIVTPSCCRIMAIDMRPVARVAISAVPLRSFPATYRSMMCGLSLFGSDACVGWCWKILLNVRPLTDISLTWPLILTSTIFLWFKRSIDKLDIKLNDLYISTYVALLTFFRTAVLQNLFYGFIFIGNIISDAKSGVGGRVLHQRRGVIHWEWFYILIYKLSVLEAL